MTVQVSSWAHRVPLLPFTAADCCFAAHRLPVVEAVLTSSGSGWPFLTACLANFHVGIDGRGQLAGDCRLFGAEQQRPLGGRKMRLCRSIGRSGRAKLRLSRIVG